MSYAAVTAHNAPPLSAQPHPDLGLLHTEDDRDATIPDVSTAKVNVVPHDFKQHPVTETMLQVEHSDDDSGYVYNSSYGSIYRLLSLLNSLHYSFHCVPLPSMTT
jgi:hypothetical protein